MIGLRCSHRIPKPSPALFAGLFLAQVPAAAELEAAGHFTADGKRYAATAVARMIAV